MITAIMRHIFLIFVFRHDGRGLPARGPVPFVLLTCSALLSFARNYVESGFAVLSAALVVTGYLIVVMAGRKRPHLVAPIALVCLGGDCLAIVALSFQISVVATIVTVWQIAAILVYISKRHAMGLPP